MISRLYSIYDNVSLTYGPPTVEVSDASATRVYKSILTNPQAGLMYQYPADYDMYYIGTIDNETGYIVPQSPPQLVVKGGACVDRPQSVPASRSGD